MTPALLVAGSLTIDNVRTAAGVLLPRRAGGNVMFAALGARLWSSSVGLVSRAGMDYPADALSGLAGLGLDLGGIVRVAAPHGMNVSFSYAADGSRVRVFSPETMAAIPAAEQARFTDYSAAGPEARHATWLAFAPDGGDVPPAWARAARAVHLAAMPVQRHRSIVAEMHRHQSGPRIQIDSPWYDDRCPEQDFHTALLAGISLLMPSEADLLAWHPHADPTETAARLARANGRPVLVKQGAKGALLVNGHGRTALRWPALAVPAMDLTGAGDAFCGGFLAGFDATGDLGQAGACGTVSASFAVEGIGVDGLLAASPAEAARRLAWVASNME